MSRACCKTLAFTFLAILFAVPVFQGIWEKTVEGESLRVLGLFKKVPSEANPSRNAALLVPHRPW
jgi:hypothetical protein